jgi:hypothetical protein
MTGITVAMLGIAWEKKRVVCFKSYEMAINSKLETILNEKIPLVYPVVDPRYATLYP